jgi:hypothetical protein
VSETDEERAERQEKVLHTRISPTLDREIKRRARGQGMSVSTVVRNVLLHTFDLVEDIVTDSANIALSIAGEATDSPKRPATDSSSAGPTEEAGNGVVVAWQEVVLNLNAICEHCNAILPSGSKAALGIRNVPGPQSFICTACLAALSDSADPGADENGRSNR